MFNRNENITNLIKQNKMCKLKNICLLVGVILQLSRSCFAQDSLKEHTNFKIITIVNPIQILRVQRTCASGSTSQKNAVASNKKIENKNIGANAINDLIKNSNDNETIDQAHNSERSEKSNFSEPVSRKKIK